MAGHNRPEIVQPLALFPAKENKDLLADFIPQVETEIDEIKKEGVNVLKDGKEMKACCKKAIAIADRKMVTTYL